MVSKKLDIIMDSVNNLTENLNKLNSIVEIVMIKVLTSKSLTKEEKDQLLQDIKRISGKDRNKDTNNPFIYGAYNDYLGK